MQTPTDFDLQEAVRSIVAASTYTGSTDDPTIDPADEDVVGDGLSFNTHVIPGNDDGNVPEKEQYATVLSTGLEYPGVDSRRVSLIDPDDPSEGVQILSAREVIGRWSIQWFRYDDEKHITPRDRALHFAHWCETPIGLQFIERRGLSFQECEETMQMDAVVSFGWEARAGVQFVVSWQQTITQSAQTISVVPFEFLGITEGEVWTEDASYRSGDYVVRNSTSYRCTEDHESSDENGPGSSDGPWELASPGILIIST